MERRRVRRSPQEQATSKERDMHEWEEEQGSEYADSDLDAVESDSSSPAHTSLATASTVAESDSYDGGASDDEADDTIATGATDVSDTRDSAALRSYDSSPQLSAVSSSFASSSPLSAVAAADPVDSDRLLYDVFFHSPPFQPDLTDADFSSADGMYDVSELEYLQQQESARSGLTHVRHTAKQQIKKVWWNCCTRKNKSTREEEAAATTMTPDSLSNESAELQTNWPVLLSPNGDLLAVVKERAIAIRGANHDFAYEEIEMTIPPYAHLQSPYPTTLAQLAGSDATFTHPFSQSHARPVAWSQRSELIAVAVRENEVAIYDVASMRLVHTVRITATSPLQAQSDAASTLTLPIRRKAFPTIASLVFREAACDATPIGYCPHLIVLAYDGSIHQVHIPAVSRADGSAEQIAAPPSPFLPTLDLSGPDAPFISKPSAFYSPHVPLVAHSRSSSADGAASAVGSESHLRKRGPTRGASASPADDSVDRESADDAKSASREYSTFLDAQSVHGVVAGEDGVHLCFGSLAFDAASQVLAVASITLTRDRTPKVSLWRISDTESPFFFHIASTPHTAVSTVKPTPRPNRTLARIVHYVKMSVGMGDIGQEEVVGDSEADTYVASLADVACSLRLSPDGHRVALMDQRGNLNIWLCTPQQSCRLIDSHRAADGCPTVAARTPSSAASVLLCDISWWSNEVIVCAYTNGHIVLTPVQPPPSGTASQSATDAVSPAFDALSMHQLHLSTVDSLRRNLLGDSAESVHGIPTLTRTIEPRVRNPPPAQSGGRKSLVSSPTLDGVSNGPLTTASPLVLPHRVFLLECERRFLRKRKVWSSVGSHDDDDDDASVGFDAAESSPSRAVEEAVQLRRTFRLLSLCQSTPEEFLVRKVESRQYDDALALARACHLHTDIIFKSQWTNAAVSHHSLQNYLARVEDDWWVLRQLIDRLFDTDADAESGRLIVDYALQRMTSREKIDQMRQSGTGVDSRSFGQSESLLLVYRLMFLHYQDRLTTFTALHRYAPPSVPLNHLTYAYFLDCDLVDAARALAEEEQFFALQLLFRYHREELWLARHRLIADIPESANPQLYMHLLPMPGITFERFEQACDAAEAAAQNDPSSPAYSQTLPPRRATDWVEDIPLLTDTLRRYQQLEDDADLPTLSLSDDSAPSAEVSALQKKLQRLTQIASAQFEYPPAQVRQFYLDRMYEIDARSGLLNHAAILLEYAQTHLRVDGLEDALSILRDLQLLIYTYQLDFLTLHQYAPLDDFDRLCLVMRTTTPNTIVEDLRTKADIFFQRSIRQTETSATSATPDGDPFVLSAATAPLLRRYMMHVAPTRLDLIHAIIVSSKPSTTDASATGTPRLIPNHADLISLCLECCYASSPRDDEAPDADALKLLNHIFECMPQRARTDDARLQRLHRLIDEFDVHLTATEILNRYQQGRPLQFFLTLPSTSDTADLARWGPGRVVADELESARQKWVQTHPSLKRNLHPPPAIDQECVELLSSLARKYMKQKTPLYDADWQALLDDMLELRLKVFSFVAPVQVYTMLLQCTLAKERWIFSRRVLQSITDQPAGSSDPPVMTRGEAERLVMDVAKELFNSAPSLHHYALKQAESCLHLLPIARSQPSTSKNDRESDDDSPTFAATNHLSTAELTAEWQNELNLLTGMQRLNKLGMSDIVPIEIRMAKDRQDAARRQSTTSATGEVVVGASHSSVLELLLRYHPQLYLRADDLTDTLNVLGSSGEDAQIESKLLLVESAIAHSDHRAGLRIMLNLMEQQTPQRPDQKEQASRLCYQLSQQLNFTASHTTAATPSLAKPKMHLLAHSMWSCTREEELDAYLDEFKQISSKQSAEQVQRNVQDADTDQEDRHSESSRTSRRSSIAAAAPISSFDDSEDTQTDVERLIMRAFDDAATTRRKPDRLSVAHSQSLSASDAADADPNSAVTSTDAVLLDLIAESCGIDNSLALAYLLSLSSPLSARPLLEAKIADGPSATGGSQLTRGERQETVELAMRFFTIVCLLKETMPEKVNERISSHLSGTAATGNGAPVPPSPASLTRWEIPSISDLQDCSLDTLHAYIDVLSTAYDDLLSIGSPDAFVGVEKPASLLAALHFDSVRLESKKAEFILVHCPNLDHVKFTTDAQYRIESIMELARGNQTEDESEDGATSSPQGAAASDEDNMSSARMLEIALTLCKRYHLNPWDLYMERVKSLFSRRNSAAVLRVSIDAFKADHLLSNPIATYISLVESVWPALRGDDLPRLTYFFDLCLDCFAHILHSFHSMANTFTSPNKKKNLVIYDQNLQRMKDHREIIDKIAAIAQAAQQQQVAPASARGSPNAVAPAILVDYKLLLSSPSSCLLELRKLLTEQNIFLVSRLCGKIQDLMSYGQVNDGSLFPVLNAGKAGVIGAAGVNLTDIFNDQPRPSVPSGADAIDSSVIFMLFLSKSLRKHIDAIVVASLRSPAATTSTTVTSWFANYDKLLKRLSVQHLVQLSTECAYEGTHDVSENFSLAPAKAELQARLECMQCALRCIEQLPTWSPARANASAVGSSPSDSDSASPSSLSVDAQARYYDQLVSAHTFLCIICGIFDLGCVHRTAHWRELVSTRGDSAALHAWLLGLLRAGATSHIKLKDVKRIADKIRVQKDSAEYRSREYQEQASSEEQQYTWDIFGMVELCIREELSPSRYDFHPALRDITRIDSLLSVASFTTVSASCAPSSLASMIGAFSLSLSEEHNVQLFQLVLQFLNEPNESMRDGESTDRSAQFIRTQLHLLDQLERLMTSTGRSSVITQPMHATLVELLTGSGPLRTNMRRGLHLQLLLLRCTQCAIDAGASAESLGHLANQFAWTDTRIAAMSSLLALVPASASSLSNDLCTTLAALLAFVTSTSADASTWASLLREIGARHHWPLLHTIYIESPTSTLVQAQLTTAQQTDVYRSTFISCEDKTVALKLGLNSPAASNLPRTAMQHLVALCATPAHVEEMRLDDDLLQLVLSHGFLLDALPQVCLLRTLMRFLVRRFQSESSVARGRDISVGSLAHSLALLVESRRYSHALALYYESHRTHPFLSGDDAGMRLVKSFLQQAKTQCQQQHVDATAEAEADRALNTYRAALAAIVVHQLGTQY